MRGGPHWFLYVEVVHMSAVRHLFRDAFCGFSVFLSWSPLHMAGCPLATVLCLLYVVQFFFSCCSLAKIATVSGGSQWIVGQTKQDWAISVTKPCWASPSAIRWLDNQFPRWYSVGPDGYTEKDYRPNNGLFFMVEFCMQRIDVVIIICNTDTL